jgi:hypothetical protein
MIPINYGVITVGNPSKGSGEVEGLVIKEGAHFLGYLRQQEPRIGKFSRVSNLGVSLEACFSSGVEPHIGGDLLPKAYEKHHLWLRGMSESRP